jgi:hypothetical protein
MDARRSRKNVVESRGRMAHIESETITKKDAGAWNIDVVRISQKATAGRFLRRLLNLNSHNHNQRDRRRRFYLAVLIGRAKSTPRYDISFSASVLRTSGRTRFIRAPVAPHYVGQRRPNRRAPIANSALDWRCGW